MGWIVAKEGDYHKGSKEIPPLVILSFCFQCYISDCVSTSIMSLCFKEFGIWPVKDHSELKVGTETFLPWAKVVFIISSLLSSFPPSFTNSIKLHLVAFKPGYLRKKLSIRSQAHDLRTMHLLSIWAEFVFGILYEGINTIQLGVVRKRVKANFKRPLSL